MMFFYLYYLPMILSIISFICCKYMFCEKQNKHERKKNGFGYEYVEIEKPIKMIGWLYLLIIGCAFIPIINIGMIFVIWINFLIEYDVKDSVKKFITNIWIIKMLSKEY